MAFMIKKAGVLIAVSVTLLNLNIFLLKLKTVEVEGTHFPNVSNKNSISRLQ